jgi:hypothetical protein
MLTRRYHREYPHRTSHGSIRAADLVMLFEGVDL